MFSYGLLWGIPKVGLSYSRRSGEMWTLSITFVIKFSQRNKGRRRFRRMISLNDLPNWEGCFPRGLTLPLLPSFRSDLCLGAWRSHQSVLSKVSLWADTPDCHCFPGGNLCYLPGRSVSRKNPTRGWVSHLCSGPLMRPSGTMQSTGFCDMGIRISSGTG